MQQKNHPEENQKEITQNQSQASSKTIKRQDLEEISLAALGAAWYQATKHTKNEDEIRRLVMLAIKNLAKHQDLNKTLD